MGRRVLETNFKTLHSTEERIEVKSSMDGSSHCKPQLGSGEVFISVILHLTSPSQHFPQYILAGLTSKG